jgi:hypothetical protein
MRVPHSSARRAAWAAVLLVPWSIASSAAEYPAPIELFPVDTGAIAFATFQSHNQKVVSNRHGVFFTYVHRSNADYTAQRWRLMRAEPDQSRFVQLYESVDASSAPAMETDRFGTLYLARPDFRSADAYLHRFEPAAASAAGLQPKTSTMVGGSAGKYCLMIDQPRGQLYYFAHNNTFHVMGMDGVPRHHVTLLREGPNAVLQYPHLSLSSDGVLLAAWTTQKHGEYLYHGIHAIRSDDGGQTWRNLAGKRLELPIIADDTGPATPISRPDERLVHSWLSATSSMNGGWHLVYWAATKPARQRYLRIDQEDGQIQVDLPLVFGERTGAHPNDSAALVRGGGSAADGIFLISTVDDRGRLACLASFDNGKTWQLHAQADRRFDHRIYSIGAARDVTADGWIVGVFTEVMPGTATYHDDHSGKVYFFRMAAARRET